MCLRNAYALSFLIEMRSKERSAGAHFKFSSNLGDSRLSPPQQRILESIQKSSQNLRPTTIAVSVNKEGFLASIESPDAFSDHFAQLLDFCNPFCSR